MGRELAIEVRGLSKSFHVPGRRAPATLRNRLRNPLGRMPGRSLDVFSELDFEVERGEFFGIVGRNGSGKSTLLKLLASVYPADRGSIRIAGRLAPFLELGVGFNPKLAARDNVVLNGVMMGLTPREARHRFDEVIEFAGLQDYVDLPIKNYSSGMKVRLGFAVMTHVDADVLLIDEVLAVGDAEFQERCGEVFENMHAEGRTILLVSHSMPIVTQYCERALLLHDGEIDTIGAPDLVAERYYDVNLSAILEREDHKLPEMSSKIVAAIADPHGRIVEAWVAGPDGEHADRLEPGEPIELHAVVDVARDYPDPRFRFQIVASDGRLMFASDDVALAEGSAAPGERLEIEASVENRLPPGRYTIASDIYSGADTPAGPTKMTRLEIGGGAGGGTAMPLRHEVKVSSVQAPAPVAAPEAGP
jgi:ABC-type polysaccharide/polyol phosphate transport system ATPase subunit